MDTTALGQRIATAAHAAHNQVALQAGMLVVEDAAPFQFSRASSGGLTTTYDCAVIVAANGNLVRARTVSGNLLKVDVAVPGDTLTWVEKLSVSNVPLGQGVALTRDGNNLILFYIGSDNRSVYWTISNGTHGETWVASSLITTLPAQVSGTFIRLAAATYSVIFFTSTTTIDSTTRTQIGALYLTTVWNVFYWDLAGADLGMLTSTLSDGSRKAIGGLGAADLGNGEYVVVFYANKLRGDLGAGIYSLRVSNLTATSALWHNEEPVYVAQAVADGNGSLAMPVTFGLPKLCTVGDELWCIALESSKHAGHAVDHLAYFRTVDGIAWSDRNEYLAGTDLEYLLSGVGSDYLLRDFLSAQVVVSGTRVFLIGYDMAFVASANRKVGVTTNTSVQLDITPDVKGWSLSASRAGEAASLSVGDIADSTGALLTATNTLLRAGARLILKAGYYTSALTQELLQLGEFWIDRVERTTTEAMTQFSLAARDGVKLLTHWVADAFHTFAGSEYVGADNLGGLHNALTVANGNFITIAGELWSAPIELDSALIDNVSVFAVPASRDGMIEVKFRCLSTSSSWGSQYGGIAFQFKSNTDYYAVLYNRTAGKFSLVKATVGQYGKVVAYGADLASKTVTLAANTTYYLLVQQWHNTVRAYYSTDRKTWSAALDAYTLGVADRALWGLIGTGNLTPLGALGWTGRQTQFDMTQLNPASYDATKPRVDWCSRIPVAKLCYLRSITIYVGRMTQTEPSLIVGLIRSGVSGQNPADATAPSSVVWQTTVASSDLHSTLNRIGAQVPVTIPVDSLYQLDPGVYWLWIAPSGALSSDPTANEFYDLYGTNVGYGSVQQQTYMLQVSTDLGKTWNTWSQNSGIVMAGTISVDVESNGVIFADVDLATGDLPRSLEDLTRATVAKAGVLNCSFDSKFTDAGDSLDTGTESTDHQWRTPTAGTWAASSGKIRGYHATGTSYAILKTNGYRGTWGDGLYTTRLKLLTTTAKAGIALRLVNDDPTALYGYVIELDPTSGAQRINLYRCANAALGASTLVNRIPAMVPIPTLVEFTLKVIEVGTAFKVFIDDCLAAVVSFQSGASTPALALGSFGLVVYGNNAGGAIAEFDDVRVPDLNMTRNDFVIEAGEDARAALDRLFGEDRVKYFFRGDGTFRAGTFTNRAISDTYTADYKVVSVSEEDRDTASQIRPRGRNFADRFSPALLQRWGRRLRVEDCGEVETDEQAYENAETHLRTMEEQASGASLESDAVLATELEDAIQVGASVDDRYIVDSLNVQFAVSQGDVALTQSLGLRKFVE